MSLKIGIVGLPNVGKSTLFNALLGTNQAAASNFPFCTIDPNTGVVPVPDHRLERIAELESSVKIIPATVEFVDIAGLVKGASQGQGLGNKFLSHIREVDAIAHVVRWFEDDNIIHVSGQINPKEDIETIELELVLADLDTTDKALERATKAARSQDKAAQAEAAVLGKIKSHLESEKPVRTLSLTDEELLTIKSFHLLTAKPILYIANLSERQIGEPGIHDKVAQHFAGHPIVTLSAKVEAELSELASEDRLAYMESIGLTEPGLDKVIRTGYQTLGLITYFTGGPQEARGWTITQGTAAPDAAGVIHTDFTKGFIRAETVSYQDFDQLGGWDGAKAGGKVRSEGKTYIVADGDVMLFRFNV